MINLYLYWINLISLIIIVASCFLIVLHPKINPPAFVEVMAGIFGIIATGGFIDGLDHHLNHIVTVIFRLLIAIYLIWLTHRYLKSAQNKRIHHENIRQRY